MNADDQGGWMRALTRPRFEIMPVRGGLKAARALPEGAAVSVTCSPAIGLDRSLDFALQLAGQGLRVIPHLAARRVRDREHLKAILERMQSAGIRDAFVVAGDQTDKPGGFASGLALIEAIRSSNTPLESIGVPAYPEGHPFIGKAALQEALVAKSGLADYMVSQLCFDTALIERWLRGVREQGVALPLYLGVPGVLERRRLLGIALRIGLGDSIHFLRQHGNLATGLFSPSRYTPLDLLRAMNNAFNDPRLDVAGVHINTFNQVEETVTWIRGLAPQQGRPGTASPTRTAVESTEVNRCNNP